MSVITWSQIEAECGDYRDGFVETFRKYEGQPTDEVDGSNRVVRVTSESFARHLGIAPTTFRDWIARHDGAPSSPRSENRGIEGAARRFASKLPAESKAKLVAELLNDDEVEVAPSVIARQASRPDVARAIARHDDAREAVEDAGIEHRARHMPDDLPEPRAAGRRAGDSMARKLDTDLATAALRAAAGNVAEAILCREEFGIRNPSEFAEALGRLRHLVAAVEAEDAVSDDDRSWLESIGVEL